MKNKFLHKPKDRILILGAGFLGKNIYKTLQETGMDVRLFSRNLPANLQNGNFSGFIEDIEKYGYILDKISVVIHTIHSTVPYTSWLDPEYEYYSNVLSFQKLINLCKGKGIQRFIYISSGGAIYGKPENIYDKLIESHPKKPISPYGNSKLANEIFLLQHKKYFLKGVTILRPSNIYGIGQNPTVKQGIVGKIFHSALRNCNFEIWGDGNSRKDYLYLEDFLNAIKKIITKTNVHSDMIYNICSGKVYSINEIINLIEEVTETSINKKFLNKKDFDVESISLSNQLFSDTFGWTADTDMKKGLRLIYSFLKENIHSV